MNKSQNLQFNSCASKGFKSWGSYVKSTSYSIVVKTKHGKTKFVSSICALNVKARALTKFQVKFGF